MNLNQFNKTQLIYLLVSLIFTVQAGFAANINLGFDQASQNSQSDITCEVQCVSVCGDVVIDYIYLVSVGANDLVTLNNAEKACRSIMQYKKCSQPDQQLQTDIYAEFEAVYSNGEMHLVIVVRADESSCY